MPRASSASTYGWVTSAPHWVNRRNRRHTWRDAIGTSRSGLSRSVTRQPLSLTSQRTNAPTASGSDSSMAVLARPQRPYGSGTGSATTLGWPARSLAVLVEGHVAGLERGAVVYHPRARTRR